jgi:RNA polymerase sigma factor (sigma-70 family)
MAAHALEMVEGRVRVRHIEAFNRVRPKGPGGIGARLDRAVVRASRRRSRSLMHDGHAAFLVAWVRHRRRLYTLCLRWVGGSREDAEDVLSQVALREIEEDRANSVVSNYPGWLTRLAWNLCMDLHRERASRHRTLEGFALQRRIDGASMEMEGHPEAAHLHRELGVCIQRAIDGLEPRLCEPCRRRFVDEMPYERIAEELGLTNETARKRIQEARGVLHARLGAYLSEGAINTSSNRRINPSGS